ncbi:Tyrosine recombinase XerC [Limihaloglobus sulfuriphilus]|uniref:Tyrosine recombinase XerC n=1 Tax=Limihaloglobus sulfuriphilus TaxID=1851148 RepID=A0A1Q2MFF1_9BACT|nr:tyrosine-type recombinase/integrase [Limihaloglobus sulfuriphilus]AQQ71435.1 Tyrosine recombinase XerC [Limihaloglobus sulfuriphilus]
MRNKAKGQKYEPKKMISNDWVLEPNKYMDKAEADILLSTVARRAKKYRQKGLYFGIRDYFAIHLAMMTGLRVQEIADLKCGDLFLDGHLCSVIVRCGKGSKKRIVYFNGEFKDHCLEYLDWKAQMGESLEPEAPLIVSRSTGGHMSTRGLQRMFKRNAQRAGLKSCYSIHCLRHTYACFLLKAGDWNLRLVQKQLGHARISTTQVYADVMMPDMENALNRLYAD